MEYFCKGCLHVPFSEDFLNEPRYSHSPLPLYSHSPLLLYSHSPCLARENLQVNLNFSLLLAKPAPSSCPGNAHLWW